MPKILIIEDDIAFCQMLQHFLQRHGHSVEISYNAVDAKAKLGETDLDLIISDLRLPDADGISLLEHIKQTMPQTPVILMTGHAEVNSAVMAMKKGAYDYISKPFTPEEMLMVVNGAFGSAEGRPQKASKNGAPNRSQNRGSTIITGISEASRQLEKYVQLVGPTDISILITGESGTGKEVTAKAIHQQSHRSGKAFVAVDCGAIPKELATSEFFGHVKGSFTGAIDDKIGHFEAANGGTLFLDEIGNLSYENQVQLLRALQERKIKRVGSTKEIDVDLRIIAATNENLQQLVDDGKFREDLYHRLNEFSIEMPSLRNRIEDLPLFSMYFLEKANAQLQKQVEGFSREVEEIFKRYDWPGNLRELQNVIKRAVLLTQTVTITPDVLPKEVTVTQKNDGEDDLKFFSRDEYEKDRILQALKKTNFNKSKAAKLLQITRKTLYNKINQYEMDV